MSVELAAFLAGGVNLAAALVGVWALRLRLRFLRDVFWARLDRRDLEAAGAVLRAGRRGAGQRSQLPPN